MERFFPLASMPGSLLFDPLVSTKAQWRRFLAESGPVVVVAGWSTPRLPTGAAAAAGGTVRYVCQVTGSVRHVVSRDLVARGLLVSNWGELVAPLVAEHALLLLLGALRNLPAWRGFMQLPVKEQRKPSLQTRSLRGKRIALHGFGAVARHLVLLLQPFAVNIVAHSEGVPASLFAEHGVARAPSLEDLCRDADALVCCEALTPATLGMLDARAFPLLPPGAVFVNVARGPIVDEPALIEAVRTRALRVASDVFVEEPLPPDSPLLHLPGCLLSPHIAGPTHDFFEECGRHALANVQRFLAGQRPLSLIDTAVYDRST